MLLWGVQPIDGVSDGAVVRAPVLNGEVMNNVIRKVYDGQAVPGPEALSNGLRSLASYGHPISMGHGP